MKKEMDEEWRKEWRKDREDGGRIAVEEELGNEWRRSGGISGREVEAGVEKVWKEIRSVKLNCTLFAFCSGNELIQTSLLA